MDNYCCSVLPANVASVLLVVVHLLSLASQLGEGVDHDARHDVPEKQPEEDEVDQVSHEAHELELLHRATYSPTNIEVHDATDDGVT